MIGRRVINPVLDLNLFARNISFMSSNITALLNYVSTYSAPLLFSLYLQAALSMELMGAAFVMLLLLNIRYVIYIAISLMVLNIGFGPRAEHELRNELRHGR